MGSFYIMYVSLIYTHTNTYVPMHIYVYIYIYIYIYIYTARSAHASEELEAALQREAAALARVEALTKDTVALTKERDSLKAERERMQALPNPCGVGIKLAFVQIPFQVSEGGAARGVAVEREGEGGWLMVEELVPGMAAMSCGVIDKNDRILAVDGIKFEQVLLGLPGFRVEVVGWRL